MKINSQQLEAFYAIAKTLHFTKAAAEVHVTQSALSQRIAKLELDLETTLFIREKSSVRLTDQGLLLLRYCESHIHSEADVLEQLKGDGEEFRGVLRIGGFSSVMRSLVLPALSQLAQKHNQLSFQFITKEIRDLHDLLRRSEVDYILTSQASQSPNLESIFLGYEKNVLVSLKYEKTDIFLDHDSYDETTKAYFRQNKMKFKPKKMRYMDDVYGLIDGVKNGYGQAVVPWHLIEDDKSLKVMEPHQVLKVPVYLNFYKQPYYRKVHSVVVKDLIQHFKENL